MRHTVALLLCLISSAASAGGEAEAVVEKWYAALTAADSAAFQNLIADDAVITLNDLETDQSKQDFLDSLGEWEDAMKGATIRRRIETSTADTATVLVCYTFPNNESLGRESFRVEGGRVKESVQITLGDSCAAFRFNSQNPPHFVPSSRNREAVSGTHSGRERHYPPFPCRNIPG